MLPDSLGDGRAAALTADCSACTGLCCVLLPYRRDDGFGADKPGQVPCRNLLADDRCGIHADLVEKGWSGCATFECFGAGQHLTAVTYGGRSWREVEDLGEMAAVLSAQRLLHEMLLHLEEVDRRSPDPAAAALAEQLWTLRDAGPLELLTADRAELHETCGELLGAASLRVRGPGRPDHSRADLAGADLREADLHGAGLRGALLIGADLSGTDLGPADPAGRRPARRGPARHPRRRRTLPHRPPARRRPSLSRGVPPLRWGRRRPGAPPAAGGGIGPPGATKERKGWIPAPGVRPDGSVPASERTGRVRLSRRRGPARRRRRRPTPCPRR
ncbi:pentapeptide repeat-containing protein [Nocardioides sp.]|uniref:pentapeptide repeat-containing protein n=1 Tax=Nocardioides sp. TaxID=35761 RepID=UPI003511EC1C